MIKFFNWVKRVCVGWWNKIFDKEQILANRRLSICNKCECNKRLGRIHFCSLCYCEIKAKCHSPEERCLKGKW